MHGARIQRIAFRSSASVLALAGFITTAAAQGNQPAEVETVIVTAEKTSQNIQNISQAVTAVSGDELERTGVTDVSGLQTVVPGLNFAPSGGDGSQVFLRGVGAASAATGTPQSIGVNVDGVSLYRFALLGSQFDIARVEVLYGPQGTLYGSNSSAGIINFVTNQPGDKFGGNIQVTVGDYGMIHTTGAVDVPLSDTLKARFAFDQVEHEGYISSGQTGDTGENGASNIAGRLSLLWTPTDKLTIKTKLEYWHGGGTGSAEVNFPFVKPSNPWYMPYTQNQWGTFDNSHYFMGNIQASYDLGSGLSLDYTGGYMNFVADESWANGTAGFTATAPAVPTAYRRYYYQPWAEFSNELRLSQQTDHFRWMIGGYQYSGDSNSDPGLVVNTFAGVSGVTGINPNAQISAAGFNHTAQKQYAIFGQGSYSINDELRVIAGFRWADDPASLSFGQGQPLIRYGAVVPGSFGSVANLGNSREDIHTDYKVGLEYDLTPNAMVYANVATGFQDGGLVTQPASPAVSQFNPEHLTSYAGGIKSEWFDKTLLLNVEGFYYDYKGQQFNALANNGTGTFVTATTNAQTSGVVGADVTLAYVVDNSLTLRASGEFLPKASIDTFISPAIISLGLPNGYNGYRLPYAANMAINLGATKNWNLGDLGDLTFDVDSKLSSGYWMIYTHLIQGAVKPSATTVPAYVSSFTNTNVDLSYSPKGSAWSVTVFAKNLENSVQSSYSSANLVGLTPPRTFGARVGVTF